MTERLDPNSLSAAVAARARAVRNMRGLSARELADRMTEAGCPMSRVTLASLETGRRAHVSVDELYAMAHVLTVTPEYLVTGVGSGCAWCNDAPPPGFACTACGQTTDLAKDGDDA